MQIYRLRSIGNGFGYLYEDTDKPFWEDFLS